MLDTLRELDICNRATDAVSKYNTNMAKVCKNLFFFRTAIAQAVIIKLLLL